MPGSSKRGGERSPSTSDQQEQKQTQSHDGACANCRTRKIRCDRERPTCGGCARDQAECLYSTPSKRVNHVKVLCQGFDEIQQRLISVQDELSVLTAAFKGCKIHGSSGTDDLGPGQYPPAPLPSALSWRTVEHSRTASASAASARSMTSPGYVTRDSKTLIEHYHGPWTLGEQSRLLSDDLLSTLHHDRAVELFDHDERHICTLAKMLLDGDFKGSTSSSDTDESRWARSPTNFVSLPPRQFLEVTLETFFKQVDFTTDIFARKTVDRAITQVYEEHPRESSNLWTVCLNLIILHALGSNSPLRLDDPFMSPLFQATRFVARTPEFFLTSRLVVLQALALLSLFAHDYHGESRGDAFFAQTCLLAKMMGLHQAGHHTASLGLSAEEVEERQKLYRSLYIRDRFNTTIRGSQSWLPSTELHESISNSRSPSFDNNMDTNGCSPKPEPKPVAYEPQLALARLQGDLHQIALPESSTFSTSTALEHRTAVLTLQHNLSSWSHNFKVPTSSRPTTVEDVSLHLAYFSTCMRLQPMLDSEGRGDIEPPTSSAALLLDHARLCCLLVVCCCTSPAQLDPVLMARLHDCLGKSSAHHEATANLPSPSAASPKSPSVIIVRPPPGPTINDPGSNSGPPVLPVHRVAAFLPSIAIFILARSILGMQSKDPKQFNAACLDNNEDILLLQNLASCLSSSPVLTDANIDSYPSKLCRITQRIASIVEATMAQNLSKATRENINVNMDVDATMMSTSISHPTDAKTNFHSKAPSDLPPLSAGGIAPSSGSESSSWPSYVSPGAQMNIPDAWFDSFDFSRFVDTSPVSDHKTVSLTWDSHSPLMTEIVPQLQMPVQAARHDFGGRGRKRSRTEIMLDAE